MENLRDFLKKEVGWVVAIIMGVVACLSFFLRLPNENEKSIIKLNEVVANLRDNHIHTLQQDVDELQDTSAYIRVEVGQVKILLEQLMKIYEKI